MPAKFDSRTFVRLDEGYDEHQKVLPLSDAAFRAHVEAICWSGRNRRQNGFITTALARKKWRSKVIAELVDSRLFDETEGGYRLHDFLDFNRSADEVAAFRDARGIAGTLGNHKRWHIARRSWDKNCQHCLEEGRLGIAN